MLLLSLRSSLCHLAISYSFLSPFFSCSVCDPFLFACLDNLCLFFSFFVTPQLIFSICRHSVFYHSLNSSSFSLCLFLSVYLCLLLTLSTHSVFLSHTPLSCLLFLSLFVFLHTLSPLSLCFTLTLSTLSSLSLSLLSPSLPLSLSLPLSPSLLSLALCL